MFRYHFYEEFNKEISEGFRPTYLALSTLELSWQRVHLYKKNDSQFSARDHMESRIFSLRENYQFFFCASKLQVFIPITRANLIL